MTQLDDLLNSLVTLLIRYHDSQPKIKKIITDTEFQHARKNSRLHAIKVLKYEDNQFKSFVADLIKQSTAGYSQRSPFLSFIHFEITFLKTLHDKKESLSPEQLEEYQALISQLFIDFKKLLMTTKNKSCEVQYSRLSCEEVMPYERKIKLSGLKKDTYIGNVFCNSGCLLDEEVLSRLNISINSTDEELQLIAKNICEEYQNTLLVPELRANYLALKNQCDNQQTSMDALSTQHLQTKTINKALKTRIQQLENKLSNYSHIITGYEERIAALEAPSTHDATANYASFFAVPGNNRDIGRMDHNEKSMSASGRE